MNTAPKLNGLHHNLEFKCESENRGKIAHTTGIPNLILQLENKVRHNLQNTVGEGCAEHWMKKKGGNLHLTWHT